MTWSGLPISIMCGVIAAKHPIVKDILLVLHIVPSARNVTDNSITLASLGWSEFFSDQLEAEDIALLSMRISAVHRARLIAMSEAGRSQLVLSPLINTADFAVGDWVLVHPNTQVLERRLTRKTLLSRRTAGNEGKQLIAANSDTMFIVTSCNADFNAPRLERYLALANETGINPVIVLTKADTISDAGEYIQRATALQSKLSIVALNARSRDARAALAPWCGMGQTVVLVGSSGVGKSTLVNTLVGPDMQSPQHTGGIREHDAKGRHTTTSRSLHGIADGGWLIDTPGIRTLHVSEVVDGIDTVFFEITQLAPLCRFRDCSHTHEPGCAVQAAVAAGSIDPVRLTRWRKLDLENRENMPDLRRSQITAVTRSRRVKP